MKTKEQNKDKDTHHNIGVANDDNIVQQVKAYCKEHGIKLGMATAIALREYLNRRKA